MVRFDIDTDIAAALRDLEYVLSKKMRDAEVEYYLCCVGSCMIYSVLQDDKAGAYDSLFAIHNDIDAVAFNSFSTEENAAIDNVSTRIVECFYDRYANQALDWVNYVRPTREQYLEVYDLYDIYWSNGYRSIMVN